MSKGSVGGRGRGWLNLNKNQHVPGNNVGPVHSNLSNNLLHSPSLDDNQFVDAPEYNDIVSRVKELDVNDDGIKFNQKIKYILENWQKDCRTGEEVEKSFDNLYQTCLTDDDLASKLVILIASRTFITQEIHEKNIRLLFLRQLQLNFEGSKSLQTSNPTAFRNSVRILGEFFSKARLANGDLFMFMTGPLISYLGMLLESANPEDLQLFTMQLLLNGSVIKSESTEKLVELLNNARLLLVSNPNLTKEGKLWLLLSIDFASSRFGLLPSETHKFYLEHLNDTNLPNFQSTPNILSVQTQDNTSLGKYQSNVNVLQLSNKLDTAAPDLTSQLANTDINDSTYSSSSGFISDSTSLDVGSTRREPPQNPGKHGRPILGAGVRLSRDKAAKDPAWRERDNSKGWGGKPRGSEWGDKKATKGWEHDDRFDNDYS